MTNKTSGSVLLEWVNTDRAQIQALGSIHIGENMSLNDSLTRHEEEKWEKHFKEVEKRKNKEKSEKNSQKPA